MCLMLLIGTCERNFPVEMNRQLTNLWRASSRLQSILIQLPARVSCAISLPTKYRANTN